MKKLKVMVLIASMLVLPPSFAADARVLGEKLDSGLGKLGANYTAWEFMPAGSLRGESLDSGLGSLTREDMETYMRASAMLRTALDR